MNNLNRLIKYEEINNFELLKLFQNIDAPLKVITDNGKNYMFIFGETGILVITFIDGEYKEYCKL
jgi:hypothetical protein